MNNLYKRPMFRKGGSAEGGITSGLQRPGYNVGKRVQDVMKEMQSVMPQRNTAKRRLGDLMIDFGIDIASRTPTGSGIGGAISTALASAKEPFDRYRQSRAASEGFEDKLAFGAYDVVKGEQQAEKERRQALEDMALEDKYKRGQIELGAKLKPPYEGQTPEALKRNLVEILTDKDSKQPRAIKDSAIDIANNLIDFQIRHPEKAGALIYQPRWVPDTQGNIQLDESSIPVGGIFYDPTKNRFMLRKTNAKDRTAFVFIDEETLEEF